MALTQGILASLAIAMLTLVIGATVRCSVTEAHAAGWEIRLAEFVPKAMEQASIPGAIIGIWQDGATPYVQAFGVRDTATGEPMATDLHMRIGSVTKTFVTTAVLQLVDQGKVGLDDPISRYVPGVPNGDAVSIRHLAAMRSGLFDYSDVTQAAMPDNPKRRYTPQDLLEIVVQHPPEFPADTKFDYNNTNTVLLGLVVEKVSGLPLDRYIDEHIVQAEHLQHTVFAADATLPSPHAHGYTKMPDGKIADRTAGIPHGDGRRDKWSRRSTICTSGHEIWPKASCLRRQLNANARSFNPPLRKVTARCMGLESSTSSAG